jgi:hypothetical protein
VTRLSAKDARAVLEAATLAKAPTWSEDRRWHVVSGGVVLVVIEPSYGGTSRTGRNGWTWWLADRGRMLNPPQPTREKAAVTGLAAWERVAKTEARRST